MTRSEANVLVATLAAAWPRQAVEQATLDIYAHDLLDLDVDLATSAVETIRRTAVFFPSIAEIRSAAGELKLGAPPPMLAWEQAVARGIVRHPLVDEARNIVGGDWEWRTGSAYELRRDFLAAYDEIRTDALRKVDVGEIKDGEIRELTP